MGALRKLLIGVSAFLMMAGAYACDQKVDVLKAATVDESVMQKYPNADDRNGAMTALFDATLEKVFDEESARFRKLEFRILKGQLSLRGEINAKNQMGGYTGFRTFFASFREDGELLLIVL